MNLNGVTHLVTNLLTNISEIQSYHKNIPSIPTISSF